VPVAASAKLPQHRQYADLHAPAHELVRRHVLASHQRVEVRARVRDRRDHRHHVFRIDLALDVLQVPAADRVDVLHQPLGVDPLGIPEEPELVQFLPEPLRISVDTCPDHLLLETDLLEVESLRHAEVEKCDAPVVEQQVVARVGIRVEVLQLVDRAEVEAEDDLAEAVAPLLVEALHLLEAHALDVLGDQHAVAGEPRDHVGHVNERVAAVGARKGTLILRLVLVVELLEDSLSQLFSDRPGVEARRDRLCEAEDHAGVREVGAQRRVDARVLDLDRDPAAVVQDRPVDLADRSRRESVLLDRLEHVRARLVVLLVHHLANLLPRHRRGRRAELPELLLIELAVLVRQVVRVDEGGELAHLHGGALQRAERVDHALGGVQRELLHVLSLAIAASHQARRLGAGEARALRAGAQADACGTAEPAPGDLAIV
jgi:hypothetical protein